MIKDDPRNCVTFDFQILPFVSPDFCPFRIAYYPISSKCSRPYDRSIQSKSFQFVKPIIIKLTKNLFKFQTKHSFQSIWKLLGKSTVLLASQFFRKDKVKIQYWNWKYAKSQILRSKREISESRLSIFAIPFELILSSQQVKPFCF